MDDREWQTLLPLWMKAILQGLQKNYFIATSVELSVAPYRKSLGPFSVVAELLKDCPRHKAKFFYDYCKRMMQEQEALENAMNSASGKIQGTLKIVIY